MFNVFLACWAGGVSGVLHEVAVSCFLVSMGCLLCYTPPSCTGHYIIPLSRDLVSAGQSNLLTGQSAVQEREREGERETERDAETCSSLPVQGNMR